MLISVASHFKVLHQIFFVMGKLCQASYPVRGQILFVLPLTSSALTDETLLPLNSSNKSAIPGNKTVHERGLLLPWKVYHIVKPTALRTAKIVDNFGLSECNRFF